MNDKNTGVPYESTDYGKLMMMMMRIGNVEEGISREGGMEAVVEGGPHRRIVVLTMRLQAVFT